MIFFLVFLLGGREEERRNSGRKVLNNPTKLKIASNIMLNINLKAEAGGTSYNESHFHSRFFPISESLIVSCPSPSPRARVQERGLKKFAIIYAPEHFFDSCKTTEHYVVAAFPFRSSFGRGKVSVNSTPVGYNRLPFDIRHNVGVFRQHRPRAQCVSHFH